MRSSRWSPLALLALLLLVAGCANPFNANAPSTVSAPRSTATAIPVFPLFSDWRVAYIGQDSNLHVISMDGKTDLVGVHVTTDGPSGVGVWTAGSSPDGAHLAYSGEGLEYIDVRHDTVISLPIYLHQAQINGTFLWSPDGQSIAVDGAIKGSAVVQLPSGAVTQAPAKNLDAKGNLITGRAYGWLDNSHLAVDYAAAENLSSGNGRTPTPQTVASLARLNTMDSQIQSIVTLRSSTMGDGQFSLTPDGIEALFSNEAFQDFPYTPNVQRIDTTTGQATPLPRLTSILPALGGFTQILWLPHTHMALVVAGFPQNGRLRFYLIDIDHDTATSIAISAFPEAWSPDGKTLLLASSDPISNTNGVGFNDVGVIGSGPYTLMAVSFDAKWNVVKTVTLTTHAMQIPTLGFVRTV